MDPKQHWQNVYTNKPADQVSWFEHSPDVSLDYIAKTRINKHQAIIDVGAGASRLVDGLIELGYNDITCMDISQQALNISRQRLGNKSPVVNWLSADVTRLDIDKRFDVWHDRAVFHFLTEPADRENYIKALHKHVKKEGQIILATFAPGGPQKCSGLDIVQYDPDSLAKELGNGLELQRSSFHTHKTPWDSAQKFCFCHFLKRG